MKRLFITDVHRYAVHQLYETEKDFLWAIEKKRAAHLVTAENIYPIGDNHDGNNCKKSDVQNLIEEGRRFKIMFPNYIAGNHEIGIFSNVPLFRIVDGIYITHGDYEFWGHKADEYRTNNKPGAGFLKRFAGKISNEIRERVPVKELKEDFLRRACAKLVEHKCHTYICGHKHPQETLDVNHGGFRFIVLKRGISVLDL